MNHHNPSITSHDSVCVPCDRLGEGAATRSNIDITLQCVITDVGWSSSSCGIDLLIRRAGAQYRDRHYFLSETNISSDVGLAGSVSRDVLKVLYNADSFDIFLFVYLLALIEMY